MNISAVSKPGWIRADFTFFYNTRGNKHPLADIEWFNPIMRISLLAFYLVLASPAFTQSAQVVLAPRHELPPVIDGNSAAFWADGQMYLFHSTGVPHISSGPDQFQLGNTRKVEFDSAEHSPVWFEAAWRDEDGTLFLFYHHEPQERCGVDDLTAPKIGAAVSYDNGATVKDLGIILESGEPINCEARNRFFSGGHGDFSVVPDRGRRFFYFFFTNYAGPLASQGVATARMAFRDRFHPAGKVFKWFNGRWEEPGLGGKMTAVFPAKVAWAEANTDSYWGPAVHYNAHLDRYVMLLNRSCCEPNWPQAGIDISFTARLSDPFSWKVPRRLLNASDIIRYPGYYPQVLGLEAGGTDALAGKTARLYLMGISDWEIIFNRANAESGSEDEFCGNPDIPCTVW